MTEGDLFDGCETVDEIMALVLEQAGAEGLQDLVARLTADTTAIDRESLMNAANQLEAAGLTQGAAIVRAAAEQIEDRVSPDVIVIVQDSNKAETRA